MTFRGCLLFLNKRISPNVHGHFELFLGSNQKITLVGGLDNGRNRTQTPKQTPMAGRNAAFTLQHTAISATRQPEGCVPGAGLSGPEQ